MEPTTKTTTKKKPVKVWAEVSVTIQVEEYQFLKFTAGMEKTTMSGDDQSVKRTEVGMNRLLEEIVDKRVTSYKRLVKRAR